jgi:hypothetical protein
MLGVQTGEHERGEVGARGVKRRRQSSAPGSNYHYLFRIHKDAKGSFNRRKWQAAKEYCDTPIAGLPKMGYFGRDETEV